MKIMFLGDVHLGKKLYGISALEEDQYHYLTIALNIAIKHKIQHIEITGDLWDTEPTAKEFAYVNDWIYTLKGEGISVGGIGGDHDYSNCDIPWLNFLKEPGTDMHASLFERLSYSPYFERFEESMEYSNKEAEFIISHGMAEQIWPFIEEKKRIPFEKFDMKAYKNLKGIVLGDLHSLPTVEKNGIQAHGFLGDIPIHYTESLGPTSSGDTIKKGILVWDDDKFIRIPYTRIRDIFQADLTKNSNAEVPEFGRDTDKPVVVIKYGKETQEAMKALKAALKEDAFVVTDYAAAACQEGASIRSELNSEKSVETVLNTLFEDKEMAALAHTLISHPESGFETINTWKAELNDFAIET